MRSPRGAFSATNRGGSVQTARFVDGSDAPFGGGAPRDDGFREIVIGTANPDKLKELCALLQNLRIRVRPITDFGKPPHVHEDGRTYQANASKKARIYSLWSNRLVLADDSGLSVNALKGRPGVYSARFAGPGCTYADNNRKLLRLMDKKMNRAASFHSYIALYDRGKKIALFHGICRGRIAREAAGKHGFGYDPVFIPRGFKKTFAELSPTQKNQVSHRGQALKAFRKYLTKSIRFNKYI